MPHTHDEIVRPHQVQSGAAPGRRERSGPVLVQVARPGYAPVLVCADCRTPAISGDGRYDPKVAVSSTTLIAGARLTLVGAGFAPNSVVTVAWSDGAGRPLTGVTDEAGSLVVPVVVRANDRTGNRTLVAQTTDGQVATADVLIVAPAKRAAPGAPNWPGG